MRRRKSQPEPLYLSSEQFLSNYKGFGFLSQFEEFLFSSYCPILVRDNPGLTLDWVILLAI